MSTTIGIIGVAPADLCVLPSSLSVFATTNREDITVYLFEHQSNLRKKIKISGGGRCNFTTGREDKKHILSAYPRGKEFLKYGMEISSEKIRELFEQWGVSSKVKKDGRVFPTSNSSEDVIKHSMRAI